MRCSFEICQSREAENLKNVRFFLPHDAAPHFEALPHRNSQKNWRGVDRHRARADIETGEDYSVTPMWGLPPSQYQPRNQFLLDRDPYWSLSSGRLGATGDQDTHTHTFHTYIYNHWHQAGRTLHNRVYYCQVLQLFSKLVHSRDTLRTGGKSLIIRRKRHHPLMKPPPGIINLSLSKQTPHSEPIPRSTLQMKLLPCGIHLLPFMKPLILSMLVKYTLLEPPHLQ